MFSRDEVYLITCFINCYVTTNNQVLNDAEGGLLVSV